MNSNKKFGNTNLQDRKMKDRKMDSGILFRKAAITFDDAACPPHRVIQKESFLVLESYPSA
jgi:hypothetical protein